MSDQPEFVRVRAIRGWHWLIAAHRLFARSRLYWLQLILAYWMITVVMSLVPIVGVIAATLLKPVFAVGFLAAAWSLEKGEPPRLSHLFDQVEARDPPPRLKRAILEELARPARASPRSARAWPYPFAVIRSALSRLISVTEHLPEHMENAIMTKKTMLIGSTAVAALVVIAAIATGFPPIGSGAGTIGGDPGISGVQQAARYHGRTMTPADVTLENPEISALFQNPEVLKLVQSEAFRTVMASEAFRTAQASEAFRSAMASEAFRTAMASEAFRTVMANEAYRTVMASEAYRTAMANEAFRTAQAQGAFRTAQASEAMRTAQASEAFRTLQASEAFRTLQASEAFRQMQASEAFRTLQASEAFRSAQASEAFRTAMASEAFRTAMASESFRTVMASEAARTVMASEAYRTLQASEAFRSLSQSAQATEAFQSLAMRTAQRTAE